MKYFHIKTIMTVIVRLQVVYEAVAVDDSRQFQATM